MRLLNAATEASTTGPRNAMGKVLKRGLRKPFWESEHRSIA